jgi:hypothetical protein
MGANVSEDLLPPSSEHCVFSNASKDVDSKLVQNFGTYIPIYEGTRRHIQKTAMFISTAEITADPTI